MSTKTPLKTSAVNAALPARRLITRTELAARWGCSIATIHRRVNEGRLTPIRLGPGTTRYDIAEIEALEAAARGAARPAEPAATASGCA